MRQFFCILCDAFVFKRQTLFCGYCSLKISQKYGHLQWRKHKEIDHFYLYKWTKKNDYFCRKMVYFLKAKPDSYFQDFVKAYEDRLGLTSSLVVPFSYAPLNHAESFAKSFLKLNSNLCVYVLEAVEGFKQQKKSSRSERLLKPLASNKLSLGLSSWIFIDDVLVTGATADSAEASVGCKPEAIFSLFYKPYEV